jgi:hypothetical protein
MNGLYGGSLVIAGRRRRRRRGRHRRGGSFLVNGNENAAPHKYARARNGGAGEVASFSRLYKKGGKKKKNTLIEL